MADTVSSRLNSLRWVFFEKGLTRIWNELKAVADASLGAYTGTVAAVDYVSDLTPDVVKKTVDEEQGRDGTGGIYQGTKFPGLGAGFSS